MTKTTLQQLADYGQSAWLDYISRPLLESGKLKNLIAQGLRGMTSNPSIFNQAISSSNDYDSKIMRLKGRGKSSFEIYDALTIADIQDATDQFKSVYTATKGLDGYVSLEINPKIAHKTDEQITEGLRLFKAVGRPNLMIKVPATPEGFKVVEELTANSVNVNTTLIFSVKQYERTVEAYFAGLTRLLKNKGSADQVHSVASVFVSRIDTMIDDILEKHADAKNLQSSKGKAAVANCRIIFERYHKFVNSPAHETLAAQGANMPRVLWGSTSTKNPQYRDIKYVTELIARPTVNTLPEKTLLAFLDHGKVQEALGASSGDAAKILSQLKSLGIDIDQVCQDLLRDGVKAFADAFEALLNAIEKKAAALVNR
ncbi:MAG: transaldolase [Omnitrophica WOR_2 bacterium RIFCSPHIGHO2_01_FULL_52_10]|nr:MAG: transaldolase [Omnitrophica WOR_2 bacterium RIFCSPHIGHO2_01_FULL_52_10]